MIRLLLALCLFCSNLPPTVSGAGEDEPTFKVINGRLAHEGQFPWVVWLPAEGCGGTLIAPDVVITAAHCVIDDAPNTVVVLGGATNFYTARKKVTAVGYVKHPGFTTTSSVTDNHSNFCVKHDLALIFLNPSDTEGAEPAPIADSFADQGGLLRMKCKIAGFGITNRTIEHRFLDPNAKDLQYINYRKLYRADYCQRRLVKDYNNMIQRNGKETDLTICNDQQLSDGYICTNDKPSGTCPGDSGSGLLCEDPESGEWKVYGVVSFGPVCRIDQNIGFHANIVYYRSWIYNEVLKFRQLWKKTYEDVLEEILSE